MAEGLKLTDVTHRYGEVTVLDRQSLAVAGGSTVVITGENGVGKSTLLYVAAGLVAATSGKVTLDGHAPDVLQPSALFRGGVRRGFVFQQGGLISNLSVLANVALALRFHADLLGLDEATIDARARAALTRVDVDQGDLHAQPAHLSFGMKKRVALARALAIEPNFVFCDDPDAGLGPASATIVHDILVRLRDDPKVTLLVVSNHLALLRRLDVPPYELSAGQIIEGAARSVA